MVTEVAICQHHWMLESPHGTPTIMAVCRYCGDEKELPTSMFTIDTQGVYISPDTLRAARRGRAEMEQAMFRAKLCVLDRGRPERQSWVHR